MVSAERKGTNVLLAGEVLQDIGDVGVGRRAARHITDALVQTLQAAEVKWSKRREAERILEDLGWKPEDLDSFLRIPAGPFLYGDSREKREIQAPYWIARYPVTNVQYARFIEAGGYQEPAFWDEEGWRWRDREHIEQPSHWNDAQFNRSLCPVVGVSWYEAWAYCRWLDQRCKEAGFEGPEGHVTLPDGYAVQLPTETQWERAARGLEGRQYPWGEGFNQAWANSAETMLNTTTAVCTYPQGVSPEGVWDMSGNVWEWTLDVEQFGRRVLRGGAFNNHQLNVRCAVRDHALYVLRGFRVVVSPSFSDL